MIEQSRPHLDLAVAWRKPPQKSRNMSCSFKPGDLVRFDLLHNIGVVIDVQEIQEFTEEDKVDDEIIYDVLVYWCDSEPFWCLEFTLEHVLD